LFGLSASGDMLVAGPGNETLTGLGGNDTFQAGTGNDSFTGVPGGNDYTFINGQSGGSDTISGFGSGDQLTLEGYEKDALENALKNATVSGGSTIIELPDDTSITFIGVTNLGGLLGGGGGGGGGGCGGDDGHDHGHGHDHDHNDMGGHHH
jgi:hypothetical protein